MLAHPHRVLSPSQGAEPTAANIRAQTGIGQKNFDPSAEISKGIAASDESSRLGGVAIFTARRVLFVSLASPFMESPDVRPSRSWVKGPCL